MVLGKQMACMCLPFPLSIIDHLSFTQCQSSDDACLSCLAAKSGLHHGKVAATQPLALTLMDWTSSQFV